MTIPIPSGMARGKVSWRIGHDRAGTTLPGASGTVRFEPTARAVSYASTTVLPEPVETPVVAGVMTPVDLQVNDPAVWSWRVRPMVGVEWPPFALDVPAGGVDLAKVTVVEASVPTRLVTAATLSEWRAALDGKVDDTDARLAALERDTGWRVMPAFNGVASDPARRGVWKLRRRGDTVSVQLIGVGVTGTAQGFLGPNCIPTGFTFPSGTGLVVEFPHQHGTGVVSIVGSAHKVLLADNDIAWRGFMRADGSVTLTAPTDHTGLIHGITSWTTTDSWPTTLPGDPA